MAEVPGPGPTMIGSGQPDNGQQDEEDEENRDQEILRPGDQVLVTVELALPDVLVVSFARGRRNFQGALLDSTKRYVA